MNRVIVCCGLLALWISWNGIAAHPAADSLRIPQSAPETAYRAELAFGSLTITKPISLVTPPGETNRLFVIEQPGRIVVITNLAAPSRTVFLDITSRVVYGGEQGLLGLAFHPEYKSNRKFYVFYTTKTTTPAGTGLHDQLSCFLSSPEDPARALPDSEEPLISQYDEAGNHNGGDLHFGPDGYLYVALGDEGAANDHFHNGQRLDKDFFAGILRLDVDLRADNLPPNPHPSVVGKYLIPRDNPFVGAKQLNGKAMDPKRLRAEFWAIGLRNPWRFSYDAAADTWYCGDVGQDRWESVHILKAGGNYGWSFREGTHLGPFKEPEGFQFSQPIVEYGHGGGRYQGFSVTGGVVSRGQRIPQLQGMYIYGDYVTGNIWALRYDGKSAVKVEYLAAQRNVSSFGVDPINGDILLSDHGGDTIRRLVYESAPSGPPFPATLAGTGAFRDLASLTPQPGLLPYEPNVSFWSDHASKQRWFGILDSSRQIGFAADDNWKLPVGSVWVKHFEIEMARGVLPSKRRLETRFLMRSPEGAYGVTYRWDADQKNATLVPEEGAEETLHIHEGNTIRDQVWRYPSRSECMICHTPQGGYALGFNTAQLNRAVQREGQTVNQLEWLARTGYFSNSIPDSASLPHLAALQDSKASLVDRARSYLAANCVFCHQPGGTAPTYWDARYSTPLEKAGIVNGALNDQGTDPVSRVAIPGDPGHSQILRRISLRGVGGQMPPVASSVVDEEGVRLIRDWIQKAQ